MTHEIRAQFPFLEGKSPLIYLDNAATTQKPRVVIDEISSFYSQGYGNISRGSHQFTRKTT
ncbi:cysteine desulfurase CsdA, partial [candidate division WWE3 bacterium CG_4_9_14_3_um_filter_39_7]